MKMYVINARHIQVLALLMPLLLSGCGLTHSVAQGTASVAHAVFYRSVETLHLQFDPRAAYNQDDNKVTMPATLRVSTDY